MASDAPTSPASTTRGMRIFHTIFVAIASAPVFHNVLIGIFTDPIDTPSQIATRSVATGHDVADAGFTH